MSFLNTILLRGCLLFVVFIPTIVFSQTTEIDSLKHILANSKEDTNKINTMVSLSDIFFEKNEYKSAKKYIDSTLILSRKLNLPVQEFKALIFLGKIYWMDPGGAELLGSASTALTVAKKIGDKKLIAEAYIALTFAYQKQENLTEAIKNAFNALRLYEQLNDKYNIADTWLAIGRAYSRQENYKEMSISCKKALQLFLEIKDTDRETIGRCYHFIGRAEMLQGNYSKAMSSLDSALNIWHETGEKTFLVGTTAHKGLVYKGLGDSARATGNEKLAKQMYEQSLKNHLEAENISKTFGDTGVHSVPYQTFGDIYIRLKKFGLAHDYLKKALEISSITNSKGQLKQTYQSLYILDSTEGNYKLAFEHLKLYNTYKDSIAIEESLKKAEGYKMQYEFDKREDSLKQKQIITETKLRAEKKQKYFYWTGLLMLALLSLFVFLNFRNQKKLNRLAAESFAKEKAELELQTLRTQLNPHFIFNCISSIDGLIQNNEKYNATSYLNKFAKLMRSVLENSKENTVKFLNDIETLKLYLDLEQLRNEDKYSTQLTISEELKNSDYVVPPLVIQPFVENAIQHGLKNRPGKKGLLKIDITRVEDHLQYIIADNGIGRLATEKDKLHDHKSYGVNMSMERIKLFNKEAFPSVKIEDETENAIALGTTVTVKLKLK